MATEKEKTHAKGEITEDDVCNLLQRYSVTTVLTLLQEVANFTDSKKIDWAALVSNTSTGITNAREYQMLWRHIAYKHPLMGNVDNGAEPLDDDSDIEFDLEASPAVSNEAATEAAAYVKVHIASGSLIHSTPSNCIEGPLTISIPNGQSFGTHLENSQGFSMQEMNITIPVFVPKQLSPAVNPAEGLDANGTSCGSNLPRKKRRLWTPAEDAELAAAVDKYGEGNWANIQEFKGIRTPAQLSQRWANLKRAKSNVLGANSKAPKYSQVHQDANNAVSVFLDLPLGKLKSGFSAGGTKLGNVAAQTQCQTQQSTGTTSGNGLLAPAQKSRLPSKPLPTKPIMNPDSMIKATAVAVGARIATPEDAASHFKATQAKTNLHIMSGSVGSLTKSSVAGCTNTSSSIHSGAHQNVRRVSTGMTAPPLPTTYANVTPITSRLDSAKPISPTFVQSNNVTSSISDLDPALKQDVKGSEERKVLNSGNGTVKQIPEDPLHKRQLQQDQPVDDISGVKKLTTMLEDLSPSLQIEPSDKNLAANGVGNQVNTTQNADDTEMMDFKSGEDKFEVKEAESNGNITEVRSDTVAMSES